MSRAYRHLGSQLSKAMGDLIKPYTYNSPTAPWGAHVGRATRVVVVGTSQGKGLIGEVHTFFFYLQKNIKGASHSLQLGAGFRLASGYAFNKFI